MKFVIATHNVHKLDELRRILAPLGVEADIEISQLDLKPYANGSNTIHIYARLSNGELLEAFQTVLKVE